ncbi:Proteinase inhibitor I13 [Macleaya cordata]|uniref:Proteinase inhibitor I13 n=1 Tax=Macleaya cordata TaxID=56857 RepID=A0A200Q4H8_MACCD|nr:Proteinase inhibitor I13 [Macleaya cordata]
MATICKGKDSWPELVGVDGQIAAATIESQNSNVDAIIVLEGSSVPEDFRCTRVWVWVNKGEKVIQTPRIG